MYFNHLQPIFLFSVSLPFVTLSHAQPGFCFRPFTPGAPRRCAFLELPWSKSASHPRSFAELRTRQPAAAAGTPQPAAFLPQPPTEGLKSWRTRVGRGRRSEEPPGRRVQRRTRGFWGPGLLDQPGRRWGSWSRPRLVVLSATDTSAAF